MAWRGCLFVFLIIFNYIEPGSAALSKATMQSTKAMMKNLCKGRSKVSQDVLNQLKTGVFVDDRNLKCYIHCCLGMMKTMKKDKLTIADATKQIELLLPDDMKEASLKQLNTCKDTAFCLRLHSLRESLEERYTARKKLTLNVNKSKIMIFKKGRSSAKQTTWSWNGEPLEEVKQFKYLGYLFQKNNSPDAHLEETRRKALIATKRTWGLGERLFRKNFPIRMQLWRTLVQRIILYAAEVWGWITPGIIEAIQTKYVRWVLGLRQFVPAHIVLEEAKILPLGMTAGKRALKYELTIRKKCKKRNYK